MAKPHNIQEWETRLLNEWHEKNEKKFSDYSKGSHFKALWKCNICSHEWVTAIKNRRLLYSNCPNCRNISTRGKGNPRWKGYESITGRQWCVLKLCAVKRHIPFEITKEEAWNLFEQQSRKCALTGIELTMYKWEDRKNIGNASLDRIDSNRSYTVENVQWIDKCLQPIKLNWEQSEFIQTCKDVARHAEEKNIGRIFPNLLSEEKSEEKFEFKGNKHAQWKGCGEIGQTTWYRIKQNAQRREIELSIAIDYVWDIFLKQNRKCALTGKILRMRYYKGRKEYGNASLDRIDSSKGYVNGNVQWIDKKLQHIKRNLTDAEFIAICKKVAAYQIEKLGIPSFKQWAKKTVQKGSS